MNQKHSPERNLMRSVVDPFILGADETQQHVMASSASASRGLRLHRAERTEGGATRRTPENAQRFLTKHSHPGSGSSEVRLLNVKGERWMTPVWGWDAVMAAMVLAMIRGNS